MSATDGRGPGEGVRAPDANGPRQMLELSCDGERVAFIFNPASGKADAALRRRQVERLLRDAGVRCEILQTTIERGAGPLAREAVADGIQRILVSGGDGTVMAAAGALAGTGVALGIVPGGTGNLFAINLGIPLNTVAAVRIALTGCPTPIDIGCCNGRAFVLMAGMGWDAKMIRDADRALKKRLGVFAYFWAAVKNLAHPSTVYRVQVDGRALRRQAKTVLVANLGRITGGLQVIPDTHPRDGYLEVAIVRAERLLDFAGLFWNAILGKIREDARLERHRGREIVIETAEPEPLELDGDADGETTRAEFRVMEQALYVVLQAAVDEREPVASAQQAGSGGPQGVNPLSTAG